MHFVIVFLSMNYEGGLISESFSRWLKSTKKLPNHAPKHYLFRRILLRGFFFGDLCQIEKLSEIKPPLNVLCGISE